MRNRAWVFTLNNYETLELEQCRQLGAEYLIVGREVGEQGTPHLQGYAYFSSARTLASLKKKLPRAHWEMRRGTHEQARDYCKKEGTFEECGEEPQKKGGDNIEERIKKNKRLLEVPLIELVESGEVSPLIIPTLKKARYILASEGAAVDADDVRGVWIWGEPGIGKSQFVRDNFVDIYMKSQNKWFDGYTGQETILIDDFDEQGSCLSHYLKIWSDRYACNGEVKGSIVPLKHRWLVVTSNYPPSEFWSGVLLRAIERRFRVTHMGHRGGYMMNGSLLVSNPTSPE